MDWSLLGLLFGSGGFVAGLVALLRVRAQNKVDESTAEAKEREIEIKVREQLAAEEAQFRLSMSTQIAALVTRLDAEKERTDRIGDRCDKLVNENAELKARIAVLESESERSNRENTELKSQLADSQAKRTKVEARLAEMEKHLNSLDRRRLSRGDTHADH